MGSILATTRRHFKQTGQRRCEAASKLDLLVLLLAVLYIGGFAAWIIDRTMTAL